MQQANVDAQHARITAEAGPALYLAKLFGSNDTEAVVRLITALLVLDPLAVLLTLAAGRGYWFRLIVLRVRIRSISRPWCPNENIGVCDYAGAFTAQRMAFGIVPLRVV